MKWLIVGLVVMVLVVGGIFLFWPKPNFATIDTAELKDYTIKQSKVLSYLGNEQVVSYDISPVISFSEDNWPSSPTLYRVISDVKPSCKDEIEIGDSIRAITLHTDTKIIWAVYSIENSKLVCVLSYQKDKYAGI